jgi:AraC-like DNA-binding protein
MLTVSPLLSADGAQTANIRIQSDFASVCRDIPPLGRARVTAAYAACAIQTARDFGADMDALGAASDLDFARELPSEIPVRSYLAFLDAAARQLNEPLFGLKVGQRSRVADAKAYYHVLMACRDIRTVVEQVSRFEPLMQDIGRSQLVEFDGVAHYRAFSPWMDLPGIRHFFDYAAAGLTTQASWLTTLPLPVVRLSTTFDAPPAGVSKEEYARSLRAPITFGAEFNEITFPARLLSLPIPSADGTLFEMLKRVADDRLARFRRRTDAQILNAVRARLDEQIRLGRTSLREMATALGISQRTLQRKLTDAGATFGGLVDEVRREQAIRYVSDGSLSLTEVAFLLGYSDQSAFNHAFRKWFDAAPSVWRRENGNRAERGQVGAPLVPGTRATALDF